MTFIKNHWPWLLLGAVALIAYTWRGAKSPGNNSPVPGDGAWVSVQGGKETVLPNYSGL